MSRPTPPLPPETDGARTGAALAARLRERREEIEEALFTRATAVEDDCTPDPEYQCGFRAAVAAAFEHSLAVIESSEPDPPPLPAAMLVQARAAARNSIGLDVVLRRYVAGSSLLDELVFAEVDQSEWQALFRIRSTALERLLAQITAEYEQERERRSQSSQAQTLRRVQQLLSGEPVDAARLNYDFDLHHVAIVAKGRDAAASIRNLAKQLEVRLLLVQPDEETVWAWLGERGEISPERLNAVIESAGEEDAALALGDPVSGVAGWRQSHRQALSALLVVLRSPRRVAHYSDVCLLASMIQDDLLLQTLRTRFLMPLEQERDGGETLRSTLSAFFAAEGNGASSASALGVTRQTIANRLRAVEARLGRPVATCRPQLEAALALESLREIV